MGVKNLQQRLLEEIQKRVPKHSVVEMEVAQVLGKEPIFIKDILLGREELSMNDAWKLAEHYQISLEGLTHLHPSVVPFRFRAIDYNLHSMKDYFHAVLTELRNVDGWGPRRLIYAANDFPVFSLFQFPDLAAFKLYFWGRTVYQLDAFKNRQFSLEEIDKENLKLGEQTWRQYLKMPSIEIWSSDIVSNVLKQIYHAYKNDFFKEKKDALRVCDQITLFLDHIKLQAEQGRKYHPKNYPPKRENYQLYYNEVAISNNTILFNSEDISVTFVLQNALNYLVTDSEAFCLKTEAWMNNLIQNSTLISIQNTDLRENFFKSLKENIAFVKQRIEVE